MEDNFMNFKTIFKPLSIALLAAGISHAASAMENPANVDLIDGILDRNLAKVDDALNRGANIDHSINISFKYDNGEKKYNAATSLYIASLEDYLEIIKLLLDRGADVNGTDMYGETSLHVAAKNNHPENVKLLLNHGADINYKDTKYKQTPLHIAARWGSYESAKLLLNYSADIDSRDGNYGRTALHLAAQYGKQKIVKLLLDRGANINCQDHHKDTALGLAARCRSSKIKTIYFLDHKTKKAQEAAFTKAICNERLLETWKSKNMQNNIENNINALLPFIGNRDKQENIVAETNQSLVNRISSFLSGCST
jgi:ankyrin repeat protein